MTDLAAKFDQGTAKYQAYGATPWGRLRSEMIWRQLQWHLPHSGLRILDAGCGLGELAIRLAGAGHQVTAVDFSAEMLAVAQREAQSAGVELDWRASSVKGVARALSPERFDLILCHSVLSYVDDPMVVMGELVTLLKADGILSLVSSNPHSRVLISVVRQHDFAAAMEQLAQPTQTSGTFGLQLNLPSVAILSSWLCAAGMEPIAHYGVRVINDLITDNQIKHGPKSFADLLELEMALCQQSPDREIAAFSHLIA